MTTQIKTNTLLVKFISDDLEMGRGNFVNGKVIGYEEYHPWKETTYYIR
jgi:hypothetical protein